jgi:hypothetical protein
MPKQYYDPTIHGTRAEYRASKAAQHKANGAFTVISGSSSFEISLKGFEQRINPELPPLHSVADAAIEYAAKGWHVFPVPMPAKQSHKCAKHSNGRNWGQTTDPDEIKNDFSRWPNAGVGIATGHQSGIFVVEADTAEGHAVDGIASLAALEDKHGTLPPTLMQASPSGSVHRFFKHPGEGIKIKTSASEIAPGVDVRGDGGMVVAAPSVKPAKGRYRWLNDLPVGDAPPWLLEKVVEQPRTKTSGNRTPAKDSSGKPYSDEQLKKLLEDSREHGKRQNAMCVAIAILVGKGLSDLEIMMEIGPYLDKPGFTVEKIKQLLQSARDKYEKPDPDAVTDETDVTLTAGDYSKAGLKAATAVEGILQRFIAYPTIHCRKAHTLWIMHTHVIQHFDTTPRIAFLSPEPASGKSRALEITARLVSEPVSTVNVSPAYLFRKVGDSEGKAVILFDEIDTVFGPKAKENEEIRGLLNAGYCRGQTAGRCVSTAKGVVTEEIPAFAPVALAGLGWLPDTILSRSIIVRMRRRAPCEYVEPYRRRVYDQETDRVLLQLQLWAETAWPNGLNEWPHLPKEIQDRDADIWEPLIAIADGIGGAWPEVARAAAVALVTASKDRGASLGIRLLADIKRGFGDLDQMRTADILLSLTKLDEAPWGDLGKGKQLDARGLAVRLREYDVEPSVLRFGEIQVRGYTRAAFKEAWDRYLGPEKPEADPHIAPDDGVTSVTSVTTTEEPCPSVTDVTAVTASAEHIRDTDWSKPALGPPGDSLDDFE